MTSPFLREQISLPLGKGVFLLSIDTELAWGSVYNGSFRQRTGHYQRTREAIVWLLSLLERYQIRATWATVGHLFLDRCRVVDGVKHPEVTRPSYQWFTGDWFDADPCTGIDRDPFWYGPDIIEGIMECRVPQEIGCHGFSHMIAGDPGCSRECFDSELKACRAAAARWGVILRSFVFPRNSIGHLDVLAENGFVAFRGPAPAWHAGVPGPFVRMARLVDRLSPGTPPVTAPRWEGGLWDLPASYFYPHRDGWARLVPVGLSVHKARLGLERAVQQGGTFHLWFHPFNLASDLEGLLEGLEVIFQHVYRLQESGQLVSSTMGELAASLPTARQQG